MSWDRREFLRAIGSSSASGLLFAFGCTRTVARAPAQRAADVRGWLRDAVAKLAAVHPAASALAVTRTRTSAALDVMGIGVGRERRDGVVLAVRDAAGRWREHATSDLSASGIAAAVRVLRGASKAGALRVAPPTPPLELREIDEQELKNRLGAIQRGDPASSRIVYSAALIDIDDVDVWAIAPTFDRQVRSRRIRQRATRAAWAGTRPQIDELERGWEGDLDDEHQLRAVDIAATTQRALQQMTPGQFPDGEAHVLLEPTVAAQVIDALTRGVLSPHARLRPEVTNRIAVPLAAQLSLVDDPLAPGSYGGFAFDDAGGSAVRTSLIEAGRVVGVLAHQRRAGHIGELVTAPSHLSVQPGTTPRAQLVPDTGWLLEGRCAVAYDPASDRAVITVARARELKSGSDTGRVYADVELVGALSGLLASIDGVAAETATAVLRGDGEPLWRSVSAPWLRLRGVVRASRGSA